MPRNIGRIEADMTLDSRGVARGARDATRSLQQIEQASEDAQERMELFREQITGIGNTFRTFGIAVGAAAAGVAVVGRQITEIADFGRELSALSDQVGISVESFQRFRQAFVFAGGDYDEAIETARDFAEAIGLAAQGTGEQARAFERLGFSARDVRRLLAEDFTSALRQFSEPFSLLGDREQLTLLRDIGISRTEGIQNLLRDTADFDTILEQVGGIGTISEDTTGRLADLSREIIVLTEQIRNAFAQAVGESSTALRNLARDIGSVLPDAIRSTTLGLTVFGENLTAIVASIGAAFGLRVLGQGAAAAITGFGALRAQTATADFAAQFRAGTARQQQQLTGALPAFGTATVGIAAGFGQIAVAATAVIAAFEGLNLVIRLTQDTQRQQLIQQAGIAGVIPEGVFDDSAAIFRELEEAGEVLSARREELEQAAARAAEAGGTLISGVQGERLTADFEALEAAEAALEARTEEVRRIQARRLLRALNTEEQLRITERLEREQDAAEAARQEAERRRAAEAAFQARIRDLSLTTPVTTIVPQFTIPAPDLSQFFPTDVINRQFGALFEGVTGQGFRRFPGQVADDTEQLTVRFQDLSLVQQGMILSTNELANAFGDLITSITDGVDSLGAAAATFAREFVEVLLNNLVLRPLAQNASTLLGGFFGIGQPAQTGAVGGPFGPGLLITGETGREATFMNGRGFTLNPQDTERLLNGRGDTNVSVVVNGSVDDPRRFAQEIAREVQLALVNNIDTLQRSPL